MHCQVIRHLAYMYCSAQQCLALSQSLAYLLTRGQPADHITEGAGYATKPWLGWVDTVTEDAGPIIEA